MNECKPLGLGYLCCEGSDTRPGCDKWLCNTGEHIVNGKYVPDCANKVGAGAMFCALCGCSWCHDCGPGMAGCVRWDGGDDDCRNMMCNDCAFTGDAPKSVRCNVCSHTYCAGATTDSWGQVHATCIPEGSVRTSDTFTCDACVAGAHTRRLLSSN